jgi:hypothetical protein
VDYMCACTCSIVTIINLIFMSNVSINLCLNLNKYSQFYISYCPLY